MCYYAAKRIRKPANVLDFVSVFQAPMCYFWASVEESHSKVNFIQSCESFKIFFRFVRDLFLSYHRTRTPNNVPIQMK